MSRSLPAALAALGLLLAGVYTIGSFSQLIVGRLIDRFPLKPLFFGIAIVQVPLFVEPGEKVKVDTRTGAYIERVK